MLSLDMFFIIITMYIPKLYTTVTTYFYYKKQTHHNGKAEMMCLILVKFKLIEMQGQKAETYLLMPS